MCIGTLTTLVERWQDGGAPVGRVADGCVVSLSFVPDAAPGDCLLLHLGIPVEVVDPEPASRGSEQ
jgi:hypothetical protein